MQYEILSSQSELYAYKTQWQSLEHMCDSTPFQSFTWNYEWFRLLYKKSELFVVVIYETKIEEPLALFPTLIDGNGCLRFIADIHSDYNMFLINKTLEVEKIYKLMKLFKNAVENNSKIKEIEFRNTSQRNKHFAIFESIFDYKKITYQGNASAYIDLKNSKDLFSCFTHFSAKKRHSLKWSYKKYQNFSYEMLQYPNGDFPIEEIKNIKESMIESKLRNKNFMDDSFLNIIEALYKQEKLMIFHMKDKNENSVAIKLILNDKTSNHYILWIDLYKDLPTINISSYLYTIEWICNNLHKSFRIDFGRGLYDYKIRNFLPQIENQFTFYYAKNNLNYIKYLFKLFAVFSIKNFYKKHKKNIDKVLKR